MESEGVDVKVYIYDVTRGLARSMSQMFLGKRIDGIWHTGIVAYGQEYFFGGMGGITHCPPGGTILGQPDEIKHLGKTQIPYDMFMEYLADLSKTTFRPETYHLLNHNCNTFSSELAQFLTGNDIPKQITELPAEVLQTPFGQMIKPFLDSMSVQPTGGHTMFSANNQSNLLSDTPPTPTAGQSNPKSSSTSMTGQLQAHGTHGNQPQSRSSPGQSASTTAASEPVIYSEEIPDISVWSKTKNQISERVLSLINEVYEYLSTNDDSWSLGPNHVREVSNIALDSAHVCCTCAQQLLVRLVLQEDIVGLITSPTVSLIPDCIAKFNQIPEHQQTNVLKIFTNVCGSKRGHEFLMTEQHQKPLTTLVVNIVLCESATQHANIAIALCYNLTGHKLSEDMELELGSALFSCVDRQLDEPTAFHLMSACSRLTVRNQEVRGLAGVLGLDLSKVGHTSNRVRQLCEQISSLL